MWLIASPLPQPGWFARRPLREWIAPFGRAAIDWVDQTSAKRKRAWWIPPLPELSRFRLQPAGAMGLVLRRLQQRHARTGDIVIWSIESDAGYGLDDFEIRAVMGTFATVEHLWQTTGADQPRRTLAVGRLRGLLRAYLLQLSATDPAREIQTGLRRLRRRRIVPILLLKAEVAAAPDARKRAQVLAPAIASGRAVLALSSDAHDLVRLKQEIEVVRYAGLPSPTSVRLRADFPWSSRIVHELRQMGLSTGLIARPSDQGRQDDAACGRIDGPYQTSGSYVAALFDRRVPAAILPEEPWIEVVCQDLSGAGAMTAHGAATHQLARLEPLLDFTRMERYLRDMTGSVPLQQRYHEYRVYNWPAPAPGLVLQAFDAGFLCEPGALDALLTDAEQSGSPILRWAKDLEETSSREAIQRLRAIAAILGEQRESHSYLEQVTSEPLRADIEKFVSFLPSSLGVALELGCGYGQLARRLMPRASRYALLELSLPMLRQAPSSRRVAADIHALPFRAAVFDSVIANNVLEHAYDPVQALSEVARALVRDGALYAFIPLDALNAEHGVTTHLWKADRRSVRLALEAAGLALCREELVDLYALGVPGAFPQCNGLVLAIEAKRRAG